MNNNYKIKLDKWKALVLEPTTLIIGIDVSKNKHDACFGTRDTIFIRRFSFLNSRKGF